ncbi:vanadium-dependent haloperoxidase [Nonomuraea jiangxiensis]|uniref:vanadium-dependent haloperoxidase n=1 Tax=Nonomuraea jiangxiensis TaxID=633440 RepID=UPI001C40B87B|nr:vanadium-dependent haloperoxidase [Nonomuraea jiangxiensis]
MAVEWYDVTADTIAAAGSSAQVTNSRTWAISWLSAARALRSGPRQTAFQDAALASAVHTSLAGLIPARTAELDAAFAATLARIPASPSKDRGVAAGAEEATALLAERAGDGLDPASVSPPYPVPQAAPGVWQPTPPAFGPATQAGTRYARPFLLGRADRFRPEPPPALGSPKYRADLEEVRDYGALNSSQRTQAQTDIAQFWLGSSLTIYNGVLRAALVQSRWQTSRQAELVALFHVALVDTQIATSDAKYTYERWRPVTALRAADTGHPSIPSDPTWAPLHTTPSHPDYPSGHNTYSGAAEQVLTSLIGAHSREPFALTSPTAPGVTRTYTTWKVLTDENVGARVWSGIHTRSADKAGATLGRQVAAHTLRHAARLLS